MRIPLLLLGLIAAMPLQAPAQAPFPRKEVIGYYPSWRWSSREHLVTPARLPYEKLTMINYAFFVPLPDGSLVGKDSVGDSMYLRGNPDSTLVGLAHAHGVRVVLSLGGWEDSDHFPAIAASARLREALARSCVEAIETFGFDGIDIDWEYPGFADHKGTPADRENFTLLLTSLRESLDALGETTGKRYLLTAALPAGASHIPNLDLTKISRVLDFINLMTYDFHGAWDPLANHNCPLYPSAGADTTRCVDWAFRQYHEVLGVPASKLNLGLPFYGRTYAGCAGLNASHTGTDTVFFPAAGAAYHDILTVLGRFTRRWDGRACVPYLVNEDARVFVSYDDEESIRAKARYIVDRNAGGAVIWEITGDFLPDGTTPLLDALRSGLEAAPSTVR